MKSVSSSSAALPFPLAYLFFPLIALALCIAWPDIADAKRMGGGGSFGSKSSYGSSYKKPTQTTPGMTQQAAPSAPSRFGGLGGMMGGLLMGGLIGSMLFGGGFAGPGMLDMLLLAMGGFLLFKFIRSRRAATANSAPYAYQGAATEPASHAGWGRRLEAPVQHAPDLPRGFDEQEFLKGAKALYVRLQGSWDRRDIDDIRQFASPEVHAEIARQAADDPAPSRTEILMVEARILEARTDGPETVISVLFDALLREDGPNAPSEQIREVWHIGRNETTGSAQWTLEGIQQLEV